MEVVLISAYFGHCDHGFQASVHPGGAPKNSCILGCVSMEVPPKSDLFEGKPTGYPTGVQGFYWPLCISWHTSLLRNMECYLGPLPFKNHYRTETMFAETRAPKLCIEESDFLNQHKIHARFHAKTVSEPLSSFL